MKALMNCYQHNATSTHVCIRADCPNKLSCASCISSQHTGHVDSHVMPLKHFADKIFREFQRPEVDRLKRVQYKDDITLHVSREFQYLREKTITILKEREQKLHEYIDKQWVHSQQMRNIIEHIELMRENKVYEDGLKLVIPLLSQGVQDTLARWEKDKLHIVNRVKELINQVKTVMDGLFFIGNQYQLDQHQMKIESIKQSKSELNIKQSEDRLFKSAIITSKPLSMESKEPYGLYQQYVDGMFPESNTEYVQEYSAYPLQQFQYQQEQFERTEAFTLFGVLEHQNMVYSSTRLRNGQIITCSRVMSFFDYPSLKLSQQTAHNQGIKQVVEIATNLIGLLNNDTISMYERRNSRWIPKGEFITPGVGNFTKISMHDDMFCIVVQTQLLIYKLRKQITIESPIEYLFISQTPSIYMHKFDCTSFTFYDKSNRFYSGDSGGRLYRWRVNNVYSVESVIQAANCEITGIVPVHDGRVVTVGFDGLIKLWEQTLTATIPMTSIKHKSHFSCCLPFTRDLDTFITGDISGRIQKWRVGMLIEALFELDAHSDQITHLTFNQYLLSSSADKKVKVWMV